MATSFRCLFRALRLARCVATLPLRATPLSPLSGAARSLARVLASLKRYFTLVKMNSNSCELTWTKTEYDPEIENTSIENLSKRDRMYWSSENTMKLIEMFERDCKELWDNKHPSNKDRSARQAKHEYLANAFGTTAEEISRKLHNLRTQFNNELRKIKRKQAGGECSTGSSGWEYFDALLFLMREPPVDPNDSVDGVNLAVRHCAITPLILAYVASSLAYYSQFVALRHCIKVNVA